MATKGASLVSKLTSTKSPTFTYDLQIPLERRSHSPVGPADRHLCGNKTLEKWTNNNTKYIRAFHWSRPLHQITDFHLSPQESTSAEDKIYPPSVRANDATVVQLFFPQVLQFWALQVHKDAQYR
jgi:hypothetical protein